MTEMEPMNIEHVALQVPDPAAMADWYVNDLGCSIEHRRASPPSSGSSWTAPATP